MAKDNIWITSEYTFGLPGSLLEQSMELAAKNLKEHEERALELMVRYQSDHYQPIETYVTRGSILSCIYGTHKARLDARQDHGVYTETGDAVLTVADSVLGDNIYNFGKGKSPSQRSADRGL